MAERTLSMLYTQLIDAAGCVLARRPYVADLDLDELADEIARRVRAPAEPPRLVHDEEALLGQCLVIIGRARLNREPDRERLWTQIAGVALPVVREHFGHAIEATRRNTVATTDQDYSRRR